LKKNIIKIDKEKCKSCELCISECKQGIIAISKETNSIGYHPIYITDQEKCIGCTMCAIACPDCVIEVYREE
jgi:2-oxoglutarate ferredoxin oxidoreductase subunit delta